MLFLSDVELKEMLEKNPPIVSGLIDADIQVQQVGIDFTVNRIERLEGAGSIDFSNEERVNCKSTPLEFDSEGWVFLPKGAYCVVYNEHVNLSADLMMLGMPRSSMVRNGCTMGLGFVDPGYCGRMTSLLNVHNGNGLRLKKNARIIKWAFVRLSENVKDLYNGVYKGENTD
ncbi:MAG: deoxyuridine 5'-triphosphate nucleotidohydrolase [Candidatus Diapherotrites archaeon]|nr:deoxyuridine 5'-triphosphate nucleotidohydrolase [Candidatus Diapherotrites archaeon]